MKQKGFSSPIIFIAVIIAILVGLYFYKNSTQTEATPEVVMSPTPTSIPSPSTPAFEPAENGFKKYKNSKYEITFPEEWIAHPTTPGFGDYQSFSNKEYGEGLYNPGRVGLNIRVQNAELGYENEQILHGFSDSVGKVRDGEKATTTKITNLEINGLKAAKVFQTSQGKPTEPYLEMHYWIKIDDKTYYELSFGYEVKDKGKFDQVMDQISKSFKLN